jgi:hypothetical protein
LLPLQPGEAGLLVCHVALLDEAGTVVAVVAVAVVDVLVHAGVERLLLRLVEADPTGTWTASTTYH